VTGRFKIRQQVAVHGGEIRIDPDVVASHGKGIAAFLSEERVAESRLKAAIDATGYTCLSVETAPYDKKGLFSRK